MWKPIILDVECIVCNKSLQKINHDPREVTRKMGKITNRRSRTPNWSIDEKQFLLELINERKVVITRTNNGPNHYEEKDVAWNEILHELAVRFGEKFCGSSIKKVKTQWQNMKRIAREEISLNGREMQKYTKQSIQVCNILDLVKDGVLKTDTIEANSSLSNNSVPNIEIKGERIDEDQPSCSTQILMEVEPHDEQNQNESVPLNNFECSSSISEHNSEVPEFGSQESEDHCHDKNINTKNVSSNTDIANFEDFNALNVFRRDFQEFVRFSATEKKLKLDSLKEERQVVRAMRETAELNKIIAEQRLKHILWVKRQEMTMYSGEPGSGAGKGGGGGGSIREAGGSFGKMEAAREDEYFYKKSKEQLQNIKSHIHDEIAHHEQQIKHHQEAIERQKRAIADLEKK